MIHGRRGPGRPAEDAPDLRAETLSHRPLERGLRTTAGRSAAAYLAGALVCAALLTACAGGPAEATAIPTQDPALPRYAPTAGLSGLEPRFEGPHLGPDPSQADKGSVVYWAICMACHGDRGQGLTEEWRAAWGSDQNCWASKCHASNHPPQGFQLPETIPAVLGPGTMARFADARDLRAYIADSMPWWNPGSLTPEQATAVTAYLLRERKAIPRNAQLDEANLSAFRPDREVPERPYDRALVVGAIVLLLAATVSLAVRRGRAG